MSNMAWVIIHLEDTNVVLRRSDDSAVFVISKYGKLEIRAGTVKDVVCMLFDYFFLTDTAKKIRKSNNSSELTTIIINQSLILDLKDYSVKQLCGTPPVWWDDFQKELKKYIMLIAFW